MNKHLIIPDTQVKDGVSTEHLRALGHYILEKQPEVIVMIGDWADMPSLSSYDKGTKSFEGRRYKTDIQAAIKAMEVLLTPMIQYNKHQAKGKRKQYKPRMVLTLGNHEDRITRAVNVQPELEGIISVDDLKYREFGWEVHSFLTPVVIDGVMYSHYFPNSFSNHPIGRAHLIMQKRHISATCGHIQTLDYYISPTKINNRRLQCLIAGSFYLHDEEYRLGQSNENWRGVIMKHRVNQGEYDPCFVSTDFLLEKYL